MIISLIGMSGSGKTHWSKRLAQAGFARFGCDDLIERKLVEELRAYGYSGIADMAKWMGQPFHEQYRRNSERYLTLEREIMDEILYNLDDADDSDVVIDTTGSVIYTGGAVLQQLVRLTTVVYLETPLLVQEWMYRQYLADPKPVIWGDAFLKRADESDVEALARCYPVLLSRRAQLYQAYAHLQLEYDFVRDGEVGVREFLQRIED